MGVQCKLTSDGWSDVHRQPKTNFMLVTRESAVFIKSVDSRVVRIANRANREAPKTPNRAESRGVQ